MEKLILQLNSLREADHLVAGMQECPERQKLQEVIAQLLNETLQLLTAEGRKRARLSSAAHVNEPLLALSKEAHLKSMDFPGGDDILEVGPLFFVNLEESLSETNPRCKFIG